MTGKKRKYIAPIIERHNVDQDINLVLMSLPPVDPGEGDGLPGTQGASINFTPTLQETQPFGGSSPDFSNMD